MQRDCSVTVAVVTSCTGIFTEMFLDLSSTVSVEFRVQEVTTATITKHSTSSNGSEICSTPDFRYKAAAHAHQLPLLFLGFSWNILYYLHTYMRKGGREGGREGEREERG